MEWYKLRDALLAFLTAREVDLFSYAISEQNKCLICSAFFRKILIDSGDNPDAPQLSQKEDLLIRYGRQCVLAPNNLDDRLFAELKHLFTEYEIVTLTAFAGLMIATNLINNALKVELDEYLIQYTKR
jgi:alkylhydroperoxidase family enzyme